MILSEAKNIKGITFKLNRSNMNCDDMDKTKQTNNRYKTQHRELKTGQHELH